MPYCSKLLRYFSDGNIYFITCVTYKRNKILIKYYNFLHELLMIFSNEMNIKIIAWVILPDHIHMIINPKQNNISKFIQKLKLSFSRKYSICTNTNGLVWQKRFWDHMIRNQEDMNKHINYIHNNPVKHDYCIKPEEWKYSSFSKYF
ncbi:MAG: transposase [candidate division Zixibacteria bacterium]|nr:transposase [candidate division Zixibacteria bacterium]